MGDFLKLGLCHKVRCRLDLKLWLGGPYNPAESVTIPPATVSPLEISGSWAEDRRVETTSPPLHSYTKSPTMLVLRLPGCVDSTPKPNAAFPNTRPRITQSRSWPVSASTVLENPSETETHGNERWKIRERRPRPWLGHSPSIHVGPTIRPEGFSRTAKTSRSWDTGGEGSASILKESSFKFAVLSERTTPMSSVRRKTEHG